MNSVDGFIERYEAQVNRINRECHTVSAVADRIIPILNGFTNSGLRELFEQIFLDWIWVEPESLEKRRIDGELDVLIKYVIPNQICHTEDEISLCLLQR